MNYYNYLEENVVLTELGLNDRVRKSQTIKSMAKAIAEEMAEWHFFMDGKDIMAYNGKVYERLHKGSLGGLLSSTLHSLGADTIYAFNIDIAMIKIIKYELRFKDFNVDRRYVSFNNGLVNIETMTLEPHNPNIHTECYFDVDFHVGIRYRNIIGWADRFTGYSVKTYMDRCGYKADGNEYEYIPYRKLYSDYKKFYDDIEVMRLDADMFRKFLGIFGFKRIGSGSGIEIKVYK